MLTVELWVYDFIHYSCSAYVSFMLGHHFSAFLLVSATISDLLPHHASLFSHHPATISVCPLVMLLLLSPLIRLAYAPFSSSSYVPRLVYALYSCPPCFPLWSYLPTLCLVYIGPPVLVSPPVNPCLLNLGPLGLRPAVSWVFCHPSCNSLPAKFKDQDRGPKLA